LILRGCGSGVAGREAECSALFGVAGQHFGCNFYTLGTTPHITSQPTMPLFLHVHSASCNWFCGAA